MLRDSSIFGTPEEWLARSRSDLALASVRPVGAIRLEDLCYHAQQSVEKAIKAVLFRFGIEFPRTHNIKTLTECLPIEVFRDPVLDAAAILSDYAVTARYPGDYEPVSRGELRTALHLAREVLAWAEVAVAK